MRGGRGGGGERSSGETERDKKREKSGENKVRVEGFGKPGAHKACTTDTVIILKTLYPNPQRKEGRLLDGD